MQDFTSKLRIIGAIAAKDIVDSIKNKTILGVMLGIFMMMLSGRALPLLTSLADNKTVIVHDQGKSRLILGLRKQGKVQLARVDSQADMVTSVSTASDVRLGLVLPADFDQAIAEGNAPQLTGYAVHWASQEEVDALQRFFEDTLTEATGQPITILVDAQRLYPPVEDQGFNTLTTSLIVLVTITAGIFLVPYLIGDERQTKTMDALLVSPASTGQIVAGKGIAGSLYCLVTATIAIAFNARLFVHWDIVLLAVVGATLFAVGVGLLLGTLFELPQHMNALAGVLIAVFLVPMYITDRVELPRLIRTLLAGMPSTALNTVLRISQAATVPPRLLWTNLGSVAVISACLYGLILWRIRRSDRG